MHAASRTHIEWTALLLGAALAALAVAGWQVQGGIDTPPAEVTLAAAPSDELALTPPGGTATSRTLRASEPADGLEQRTTVQNATGGPLLVGLRAEPATAELDRTLLVRVSAGGEIVFDGSLGDLRAFPIPLPPPQEQARFCQSVEAVGKVRSAQQRAANGLHDLFDVLRDRAFHGDL